MCVCFPLLAFEASIYLVFSSFTKRSLCGSHCLFCFLSCMEFVDLLGSVVWTFTNFRKFSATVSLNIASAPMSLLFKKNLADLHSLWDFSSPTRDWTPFRALEVRVLTAGPPGSPCDPFWINFYIWYEVRIEVLFPLSFKKIFF